MSVDGGLPLGWIIALLWVALQLVGAWKRSNQPPSGPPGGRVRAVHSEAEWEQFKSEAEASGAVLVVDFSARWCGPCQRITPVYEALSEKYPAAVFLKVDVDEARGVSSQCGVRAMPTFHLYKAGKRVEDFAGADERRLEAAIVKHSSA